MKKAKIWTKEKCKEKAITCESRKEFRTNFPSAYIACLRNNWLNDVCSHLRGYKSHGYWTLENCKIEALKYQSKKDFKKNASWCYMTSLKNEWIDDICSHMKIIGNLYNRCIYVYEFNDNYAYIGLTSNLEKRNEKHLKKGPVYKHIQIEPIYLLNQLTSYVDVKDAKKLEETFLKQYRQKGWRILNKIKTGGTGGIKYWTKEKCINVALKCKTSIKFNKTPAYYAARRYGWIDEINTKLIQINKPNGYWTKEMCRIEALKYKTRIDFFNGSSGVFNKCVQKKWLNDVCSHMENKEGKKSIGFYTKEKCKEEALKYKTKKEFREKNLNYYSASIRFKWIDEVCSHMNGRNPNGYWTKEKCKEEALKYKNLNQLRKNCSSAYNSAKKNKWLKELIFF